ncbi:hypothetical protein CP8484711_1214B, partial [Chlamydia psittaci 84-8471/1]
SQILAKYCLLTSEPQEYFPPIFTA